MTDWYTASQKSMMAAEPGNAAIDNFMAISNLPRVEAIRWLKVLQNTLLMSEMDSPADVARFRHITTMLTMPSISSTTTQTPYILRSGLSQIVATDGGLRVVDDWRIE